MMRKIKMLTIVGARPQIIKSAAISRAIKTKFSDLVEESVLHTGQHYDQNMSGNFFSELGLDTPKYNLETEGNEIEKMCQGIDKILKQNKFDLCLVYGDTNSTAAGAKQAHLNKIPLVHVEAGLRSFNSAMPEEANRIYADSVSTLLFSPTKQGILNLVKEGFSENPVPPYSEKNRAIFYSGDVMYDNSLFFSEKIEENKTFLEKFSLEKDKFILATVHRNYNTDNAEALNEIFYAIHALSAEHNIKIFLPLHPRTKKKIKETLSSALAEKIKTNKNIVLSQPVSYIETISLLKNCKLVMTDSGGLQKEAFFFKKPSLILRTETEWVELLECGCAILTGTDLKKITGAYDSFAKNPRLEFPSFYGNGRAAEFICNEIIKFFNLAA